MREVCRQKKKGKRYIHQRWKTRGICKCREWYIMRLAHVVSNEDVKSVVGKIMCNAKSKMRDRQGNKTEGGRMCARPVTIYPKKGLWGYERKMKNVRKKEKNPELPDLEKKCPETYTPKPGMYPIFSAIFRQNFVFGGHSLFRVENLSEWLVSSRSSKYSCFKCSWFPMRSNWWKPFGSTRSPHRVVLATGDWS